MHFGMWVYKTQSLKRNEKSPPVFSNWKRYFMWFNKGTLFYGENEGEPDKSIPVATCRGAELLAHDDFAKRKPPTLLSDFGWILKTVEKTLVFVSDSDSQRTVWVDGINGMLPRGHQRSVSGYQAMFSDPMAVSMNHGVSSGGFLADPMSTSGNHAGGNPFANNSRVQHPFSNGGDNNNSSMFFTPATPPPDSLTVNRVAGGGHSGHQRTSSMGMYDSHFGEDSGSPNRGFGQQSHIRRASYSTAGGFVGTGGSNALVPTGYHHNTNSGGGGGALVPYGADPGSPHHQRARSASAVPDSHDVSELVVMGTFVQKMRGDRCEKNGSKKDWSRKWMSMIGTTLWYGAERNQKDTSIEINKCTSVERLEDEDMYGYRAPTTLYRFGLRLKAPGGKVWVFACESELAAQGWYTVWKKTIPLSTEELAMAAHYTYESNLAQEHYLDEKHRHANMQREQEAKKKKDEQERVAHMNKTMAENLVKAVQAAEESKKKQLLEAVEAKKVEQGVSDAKARELRQQEEFIAKEVAKRLAKERGEVIPEEEEILDPNDPDYAEKEIASRVKRALTDAKKTEDEKKKIRDEKDKKDNEENRARNAEKERLAAELRDLETNQIQVHKEATEGKQKDGGCCIVM